MMPPPGESVSVRKHTACRTFFWKSVWILLITVHAKMVVLPVLVPLVKWAVSGKSMLHRCFVRCFSAHGTAADPLLQNRMKYGSGKRIPDSACASIRGENLL